MIIDSIINTVICTDCLDVMRELPDKCIDLVLTDPPYGLGNVNRNNGNHKNAHARKESIHKDITWNDFIPDDSYFNEIYRISKNQIIWGCNYYQKFIVDTGRIVHYKKLTPYSFGKNLSECDLASQSYNRKIEYFEYQWSGNVQGGKINWNNSGADKRLHPTQKPIALMSWCLKKYTKPGQTIFDPFAGSGTTAIACLETGRNYILVEKDPDYVEIINKRIGTWKEQGLLFDAGAMQ